MGQQPEQHATSGDTTSDKQRRAARDRARQTLADMDAIWTPEKWAEFERHEDAA